MDGTMIGMNELVVPIDGLSAGIYSMTVKTACYKETRRIIVLQQFMKRGRRSSRSAVHGESSRCYACRKVKELCLKAKHRGAEY